MINNVLIPNISSIKPNSERQIDVTKLNKGEKSFSEILDKESNNVKFSSHASERINKRGIELEASSLQRLNTAIDKAVSKGSKEALVLMDNAGFIVDAKSKTVVTAFDLASMKDKVFTNIDTTVLA